MYATVTEFRERFGDDALSSASGLDSTSAAFTDRLALVLEDAGLRLDAWLGVRYEVPASPAPRLLGWLCMDVARGLLYGAEAPREVGMRKDEALELVRAIGEGRATLWGGGGGVYVREGERVFGRLKR